MCQAYSVSPSVVFSPNGVTWFSVKLVSVVPDDRFRDRGERTGKAPSLRPVQICPPSIDFVCVKKAVEMKGSMLESLALKSSVSAGLHTVVGRRASRPIRERPRITAKEECRGQTRRSDETPFSVMLQFLHCIREA